MAESFPARSRVWNPARLTDLAAIRQFVEDAALEAGFDEDAAFDLVLAVDEAATNIILHGYGAAGGFVEVEVSRDSERLLVRLRDRARPFDPTANGAPDELPPLEERPPGGMGIFLIGKSVDGFSYRRTAEGLNELTLALHP